METGNKSVKVFSGTEMNAKSLRDQLEQHSIPATIRNDIESSRATGMTGTPSSAVDLYVNNSDVRKADPLIKKFMSQIGR